MTQPSPDGATEPGVPKHADPLAWESDLHRAPVVGLGGSAGSIPALEAFFGSLPADPGVAFVVVTHLAPAHRSKLAELLQRSTSLPVVQVSRSLRIEPNHVYVIPPKMGLVASAQGTLELDPLVPDRPGHYAIDLFFRSLADTHGPRAAAVVLSGADDDGAVGIKRMKECGGLIVVQDPGEAEHDGMPRAAIATGVIDWVLPVADMGRRVLDYFRMEAALALPPDAESPASRGSGSTGTDEGALRDVLAFLRRRTGHDFAAYKRSTLLRRIGRRMQVNGLDRLVEYLQCVRTRPGEAPALVQDLLISVTQFFRDPECFRALESAVPRIIQGKGPADSLRIWIPACATGEEAYSIAMLLVEQLSQLDASPLLQIFATDLDDQAIQVAREGFYPAAIEADVSPERLQRFFQREHAGYRVRRELRESILFAQHDVLKDSPFSRLDLVSCRNLLIYLNREAQSRILDIFHFALVPEGSLFLGATESIDDGTPAFSAVDKKNRLYRQRPLPRANLPVLSMGAVPGMRVLEYDARGASQARSTTVAASVGSREPQASTPKVQGPIAERRGSAWPELHLKLLEQLGPPSILVDADHEIVHLSPSAGRFLQFSGGEPSHNLLRSVNPGLKIELRAALFQASQSGKASEARVPVRIAGEDIHVSIRVLPAKAMGTDMFLVTLQGDEALEGATAVLARNADADPVARQLDREVERLKSQLRDTVEQYEASTEELKASNEELQAINEELRSATEEFETSREELQSINEELTTVNHELKTKVDELAHANSDMHNLMDATAIATVFVDRDLRIKRYTPTAVTLFNLIPSDVGRPLTDLKTQLDYPQLGADALRVLEKLVPVEREVGRSDGRWYLARLLAYRTSDDRIAGVVLTLVDITERKQAEEMRLWLSAVVTASSDAIISFSLEGTILSWNHGAERIFGHAAVEAIGQSMTILAVADGSDQEALVDRVASGELVESHESVRRRKDGSDIHVSITVSPIRDDSGRVIAGTAMVRDITSAKLADEALRTSEERMRLVIENAVEFAIFSTDLQRKVTIWNSGAQRLLGYVEKEVLGASADVIFVPEDRQRGEPEKEAATALAEGRAADDRWHLRKDGTRFWASGAMMRMLNAKGGGIL